MKQKVKMLKTVPGVDDGKVIPDTFHQDQEYSIGPELLDAFISMGVVELVGDTLVGGPHPDLIEDPDAPNALVEARETKVEAPAETKPAKKKGKK